LPSPVTLILRRVVLNYRFRAVAKVLLEAIFRV